MLLTYLVEKLITAPEWIHAADYNDQWVFAGLLL